jgi:hypothetical protein
LWLRQSLEAAFFTMSSFKVKMRTCGELGRLKQASSAVLPGDSRCACAGKMASRSSRLHRSSRCDIRTRACTSNSTPRAAVALWWERDDDFQTPKGMAAWWRGPRAVSPTCSHDRCTTNGLGPSAPASGEPSPQRRCQVEHDQHVDEDPACLPEAGVDREFVELEGDQQRGGDHG